MSLFMPRGYHGSEPSFNNLFRLLDDFNAYAQESKGDVDRLTKSNPAHIFSPKFDVRETEAAYELHGELPGIEREHVNIEFTDSQTVVIRGRVERSYTSGTPPTSITEKGEGQSPHKATVEDESAEANDGRQVAKRPGQQVGKKQTSNEKYWVTERSIGEFSRTFSFPTRIDQDGVTASLKNGILSLVVPKAKKNEARRIAIN